MTGITSRHIFNGNTCLNSVENNVKYLLCLETIDNGKSLQSMCKFK